MLGHFRQEEVQFCTNYVKHRIGFEFYARTLRMELSNRGSGVGSLPSSDLKNGDKSGK